MGAMFFKEMMTKIDLKTKALMEARGHAHFDAWSVQEESEHGNMSRTRLAGFFNIPKPVKRNT